MKSPASSSYFFALFAGIFLSIFRAGAESTNVFSGAEIQGQLLAQKILDQSPAENFTNTATLRVRNAKRGWTSYAVTNKVLVVGGRWKSVFTSTALNPAEEIFTVTHAPGQPNVYTHEAVSAGSEKMLPSSKTTPFANSDFWLGDLGLDFFHWPEQRVLKKEFHRECPCTVLESVNAGSEKNAYSRVVSWIDGDSLGIVEAYAYDVSGKLLKEFTPKTVKKGANGQWQVQEIEISNVQTKSRSQLKFDVQ